MTYTYQPAISGPHFETPEAGVLAIDIMISESSSDLLMYLTTDGGGSWQLAMRQDDLKRAGALAFFDSSWMEVGRSVKSFEFHQSSTHRSAAIPSNLSKVRLDGVLKANFIDAQHGWFLSGGSLLGTNDGGNSAKVLLQANLPPPRYTNNLRNIPRES